MRGHVTGYVVSRVFVVHALIREGLVHLKLVRNTQLKERIRKNMDSAARSCAKATIFNSKAYNIYRVRVAYSTPTSGPTMVATTQERSSVG